MSFSRWQKLIASRISRTVFDPLSSEASTCAVLTPPSSGCLSCDQLRFVFRALYLVSDLTVWMDESLQVAQDEGLLAQRAQAGGHRGECPTRRYRMCIRR